MISVIIPHANSSALLWRLLSSLQEQQCEQPIEVIVVANPMEKYSEFPQWGFHFSLVWAKSLAGANRARQKGVQLSQGEILLFLDDDCEITDRRFIQKHWQHHQEASLSAVGGRYQIAGPSSLCGRIYHKLQNDWLNSHRLPWGINMHLLGGNSSYKREVFAEEAYDEAIIFGGTETELQVRLHLRKRKLKLFEDINIKHDGRLGFAEFLKKAFKQGIGAAYISRRHERPPKFIFAEEKKALPRKHEKLVEWIYKVSFEAGQKYFGETAQMTVTQSVIYKSILQMISQKIFSKEFFVWRESRTLSHVIAKELLSSTHKSESRRPARPDSDPRK